MRNSHLREGFFYFTENYLIVFLENSEIIRNFRLFTHIKLQRKLFIYEIVINTVCFERKSQRNSDTYVTKKNNIKNI
jgi:hypothetical protein